MLGVVILSTRQENILDSINEQKANTRRIFVIGVILSLQGDDANVIIGIAGATELSPENIIDAAESLGYSIHTAEAFAQAIIDAGVLFSDKLPVSYEEEVEEAPPANEREDEPEGSDPETQDEDKAEIERLFADAAINKD